MILSGFEIKCRMGSDIWIDPYDDNSCGPNSYDIHLDNKLLVYSGYELDMKKTNKVAELIIPETGLVLRPNELYLGKTLEYTETENLVPMVEGRSSIGRLGIFIHATAGFGDNGFKGFWTLEISVIKPVKVYPRVKIGQIFYHTIEGDQRIKYQGKYQDNRDVQASRLFEDFKL